MKTKRSKIEKIRHSVFTGRQNELDYYQKVLLTQSEELIEIIDVIVFYGIGGIGKSRLLNECQILTEAANVPIARIDPQVQATIFDFLINIHKQLAPRLPFPRFEAGLKRHEDIEMKLLTSGQISNSVLHMFVRGSRAMNFLPPGVSAIDKFLSTEEMGEYVGRIYSVVGHADGNFWMQPEQALTEYLVEDLNAYCDEQRLVLMIDAYERIGAFNTWVRDQVFGNLGEYALLVIAGRNRLDDWHEYATLMQQLELQPFTREESLQYLQKKKVSNDQIAKEMIDYAGGHPLALALLADFAEQFRAGDLMHIPERRKIVHLLVERITENVVESLRAALEICVILRSVNQDNLEYMLKTRVARPRTDSYSGYEAGLHTLLRQMGREHQRYNEALVYEQRLRENIEHARRYGDDSARQSERHQIIDRLNEVALATLDVPFTELCWPVTPAPDPSDQPARTPVDSKTMFDSVRRFDFVKVRYGGIALHDTVWTAMNDELRWRSPSRYAALNARAAQYYDELLMAPTVQEREHLVLERLYHHIRANEAEGIKIFQAMIDELVRHRLANKWRSLLNDINSYWLEQENSRMWRDYYNARLADFEARSEDAEKIYWTIGESEQAELRLRAYALCDLGWILSRAEWIVKPGGEQKALYAAQRSLELAPELDTKIVTNYRTLARIYSAKGDWVQAEVQLKQILEFSQQRGSAYGLAYAYMLLQVFYFQRGDWQAGIAAQTAGLQAIPQISTNIGLRAHLLGRWAVCIVFAGHYAQAERYLRETLSIFEKIGEVNIAYFLQDMAIALGMQGKYIEADHYFTQAYELDKGLGKGRNLGISVTLNFWGAIRLRQGQLQEAAQHLHESLEIKQHYQDEFGIPEALVWLGQLYEVQQDYDQAEAYYRQSLALRWTGRLYFESCARVGLLQVLHAKNNYDAIPVVLEEAYQLAEMYGYHDHLAALSLSRAAIAWEGHSAEWDHGFEAARVFYQQAMIHAVRYNRFLLDEILWGDDVQTPLHPIIPRCLQQGTAGKQMLIALRDWWKTGSMTLDTPPTASNSSPADALPLLRVEHTTREQEPGTNSPQMYVIERINQALGSLA